MNCLDTKVIEDFFKAIVDNYYYGGSTCADLITIEKEGDDENHSTVFSAGNYVVV